MERRQFLKDSVLFATVALFAPRLALNAFEPKKHVLYGDGIHDDTKALQAWLNGQPVDRPWGPTMNRFYLDSGEYRISNTLQVEGCQFRSIAHSSFYAEGDGIFLQSSKDCQNVSIHGCTFSHVAQRWSA